MGKQRVTVLLSDEEYTQVRTLAGLIPLSTWFRNLALSTVGEVQHGGERAGEITSTRKNSGHGLQPEDRRGFDSPTSPKPVALAIQAGIEARRKKLANRYCKPHHVMGCEYCIEHGENVGEKGIPE